MKALKPIFNDVNICLAGNETCAEPMMTMIYSVLIHADKSRRYEFFIMSSDLSEYSRKRFMSFECDSVAIRFIDMTEVHHLIENAHNNYITAETNYRLFILSELFAEYDRILYLDGDMQALCDITELYDAELGDKALGACVEAVYRVESATKRFFLPTKIGVPVDIITYYRMLGLRYSDEIFNAGMLLFDLKKCRAISDEKKAISLLNRQKLYYNDQDCLNILFNGRVKLLDYRWNYSTLVPEVVAKGINSHMATIADLERTDIGIIHYTGHHKPWKTDVPFEYRKAFDKVYHENRRKMKEEFWGSEKM